MLESTGETTPVGNKGRVALSRHQVDGKREV